MKTFPMFLKTTGRRVVIIGGGEQAAQKTRLILKTDAKIVVYADTLDPELTSLAQSGRITTAALPLTTDSFDNAALTFVATGCPGADAAFHALAKTAKAPVNVVDQPDLCDALTPSIVDRDPVVIAIGTEGTAPVLGRQIKTQMEQQLDPRLGDLAALAGRLRDLAAHKLAPRKRRDLWKWVFNGPVRRDHAQGKERAAAQAIKDAIETGNFGADDAGSVALVGAGPGGPDLITLRGVQRLQEADVIYYDRLIDPKLLELARRDAERVFVGKAPGCHAWPQDKISQMLVSAAQRGKRVVRLKCGDVGIFGRAAEEIQALETAGIPIEIVPGVTAASAAAAGAGTVLTQRDEIDTLVLTTGRCVDANTPPEWLNHVHPGTNICVYMGVGAAPQIMQTLLQAGLADVVQINVIAHAGRPTERHVACTPATLVDTIASHQITAPAMMFLTYPKSETARGLHQISA
jgi:uroporphyrin-III C-methyltransferase/precorrin-2 dehydrogenase/sirohydrochlorin ferrochelatase